MAEAEQASHQLQRDAEDKAARLLGEAQTEAARLRAEVEGQAAQAQVAAELAAQRAEKSAQDRADLLYQSAVADAEKLAADARERADRIGALAVDEAQRITIAAREEADTLLAEARTAAGRSQTIVDGAKDTADQITREARGQGERAVQQAHAEARALRDAARAETERHRQRDDKLDIWSARAVIAGAVGLTASGEYELARMVGFDARVAWLLPLVIDVYVVQAFRRHRDIIQAIALTIAANVIFHLADKGLFGVEKATRDGHEPKWWLIALVASVASLILWRMHLITGPPKPLRGQGWRRGKARQEQSVTAPTPPPADPAAIANSTAKRDRQEPPTGGAKKPAKKPAPGAKKAAPAARQNTAKKRRSMDEWVTDASPIFHAEFARLRHNPTATEFATAIEKAGLGKVSDSTAKNIRAEILDRAPLPELDGTE
ncbi:hypothetical protein [Streptomyces formicae]